MRRRQLRRSSPLFDSACLDPHFFRSHLVRQTLLTESPASLKSNDRLWQGILRGALRMTEKAPPLCSFRGKGLNRLLETAVNVVVTAGDK